MPPACEEIRLDDVHRSLLEDVLEIPSGEHALARRDGGRRVCGDIWEYVIVLRENRLFDEHRIVGFERFRQPLGHRFGHTTVKVDADVDVRTDVFPNAP